MSRVIYVVNDELKEYSSCGQGWDGFTLWNSNYDGTPHATEINYFANKSLDTKTSIRFIDDKELIDGDQTIQNTYYEPTMSKMKAWLDNRLGK